MVAGDNNKLRTLQHETDAVRLHLGGATLQQIVDANIGYTSTGGAYEGIQRALKREVKTNAQEVVRTELARIDALIRALWPKALKGDTKACHEIIRLQDRRSKYLGLDFSDGLAERHVQVEEAQLALLADMVRNAFGDPELGLTDEQKSRVPAVVHRHLKSIEAA